MRLFKNFTGIGRRPAAAITSGRGRPGRHRRILGLEPLEGRVAPAVFTVMNLNSSGPGSLPQAILDSNSTTGPNTIDFSPSLPSKGLILLGSQLTIMKNDVTINGSLDRLFVFESPSS